MDGQTLAAALAIMKGMPDNAASSAAAAAASAEAAQEYAEDAAASVAAMHPENYVAQAFSASSAYSAGTYVMHDGYLYRLTEDHDADVTWENTAKVQVKVAEDVGDLKSAISVLDLDLEFTDNAYIVTPSSGTLDPTKTTSSNYKCLIVPCKAGDKFSISVSSGSSARGWCFTDTSYGVLSRGDSETVITDVITAASNGYLVLNSKKAYTSECAKKLSGKIQAIDVEIDALESDVEALELPVSTSRIADNAVTPAKASFFEQTSHNLINPDDIDTGLYWSHSASEIKKASSSTANALTGLIPVEEGESYTFSGTAATVYGGYFGASAQAVAGQGAISTIVMSDPVTGSGKWFTVPTGQNIKYVAFNLAKDTTTGEIDGTYQLEIGEMATPVVPYELVYKIDKEYLPSSNSGSADQISLLPDITYDSEAKAKIASFMAHCQKKDKDVMVVGTGTSLTARSSEHCTVRADATSRPPLLHANNFASKCWDKMMWEGQQYRRFDYADFFDETGSFASSADLSDWDDKTYRYGITRYATAPASVAFTIPENAWQFNFIYRTDTAGSESVSVTVSEGNGKVEAFNGSEWVEANGYTFSMKQTAVTLSNVTVYDPNTTKNSTTTIETYQVGGNTTYQKRLKMRCKSGSINSLSEEKTVSISATSGRLLYWGVEWSPREFMITYVNAARGSHNMTYNSDKSLAHYQDNDIWDFKPDLIFTENPIHNSGANGEESGITGKRTTYWGYSTYDFFFNENNPISFVSRATANGLDVQDIEWIVFTSSLSYNFNGIDENGTLKLYTDKTGNVLSALDAQTLAHRWTVDNAENVLAINGCKYWCDAGVQLFGNLKDATEGSGANGNTFTKEGSHWNDMGSAVMAKCIAPVFDFYY